jgi:hypothetical protein
MPYANNQGVRIYYEVSQRARPRTAMAENGLAEWLS